MARDKTKSDRLDIPQKAFVSLLRENAYRHRPYEVFRDFCEIAAISISNAVDRIHCEPREARYMEIIKGYSRDEANRFAAMLAALVECLEGGFCDALGQLFMSLDLGNDWRGQFFTPYEVCRLMAEMTLGEVAPQIEPKGYITVNEPAVGAGAMIIACAHTMHDQGINYQQSMHVVAQDIDVTAVHMAYVQFSLLHIPAIVVHGNSLTGEDWGHWATPAHVMGFWDHRLRRDAQVKATAAGVVVPAADDAHRVSIVSKRIEQAEQMDLFA